MVPKAISLTLVNHSKENLQRELLQELYKPEVLEDLLKESEYVVNRRKEVVGMVQALNKAEEYVVSLTFPMSQANPSLVLLGSSPVSEVLVHSCHFLCRHMSTEYRNTLSLLSPTVDVA